MKILSSTLSPLEDKPNGKCRKWKFWARLEDGSQKSKRFSGTHTMAKRAKEEWLEDLGGIVPNAETFGAYAKSWVAQRRSMGGYSVNTIASDERHVNALERSPLGSMRMDAVKPADCRSALEWIRDHPQNTLNANDRLSNTTMSKFYRICRQIFQQAVDDELLSRNPMAKIKDPKPDTEEAEALSWQDMMELLDELDKQPLSAYVMAVYLIVCLGLRRAEACAVLDANMGLSICAIEGAVKEADGTIGPPKSEAGARSLPVMPRLAQKVEEWRRYRASKGLCDAATLACDIKGGVLRPQNLYRWWKKFTRGTAYEGVNLHLLRHSNLTRMARHMSVFDLMRYAGWSSLKPARIYIHDDYESLTKGVCDAWEIDQTGLIRKVA